MNFSIAEALVARPPRETSGSSTSNRYDFQKCWTLCKLLELHLEGDDYLVLMDFHEDVVVLDSESDPQNASCYQIKSKTSGNWTIKSICKRGKSGQSDSILEKLNSNRSVFGESNASLIFSSNQPLSAKLENSNDSVGECLVNFSDLKENEKSHIRSCLKLTNDDCIPFFTFEKTPFTLEGFETYTMGKLAEFMQEIEPNTAVSIPLIFKTLFDEIRRRTNRDSIPKTYSELVKTKSLGKTEFESLARTFQNPGKTEELWNEVNIDLISEKLNFSKRKQIEASWKLYAIAKFEPWDSEINEISKKTREEIADFQSKQSDYSLMDLISSIEGEVSSFVSQRFPDEPLITHSVILYELKHNEPIPKTS